MVRNAERSGNAYFSENLKYYICSGCPNAETCTKDDSMPIISPLSRYITEYATQSIDGFHMYPKQGSWEYQDSWFYELFKLSVAKINQVRNEMMEAKYGK